MPGTNDETLTMIERVARAIHKAMPRGATFGDSLIIARAAIEAMREPIAEMLTAGEIIASNSAEVIVIWHDMIDSALAEEKGAGEKDSND